MRVSKKMKYGLAAIFSAAVVVFFMVPLIFVMITPECPDFFKDVMVSSVKPLDLQLRKCIPLDHGQSKFGYYLSAMNQILIGD